MQIMFLVLGLVTIVVGALIFCFMPDTPMDAKFLTTAEKVALIKRLQSNQTGMENKKIKRYQVMEALTDVQTWLVALCVATLTVTNGGKLIPVSPQALTCVFSLVVILLDHHQRIRILVKGVIAFKHSYWSDYDDREHCPLATRIAHGPHYPVDHCGADSRGYGRRYDGFR